MEPSYPEVISLSVAGDVGGLGKTRTRHASWRAQALLAAAVESDPAAMTIEKCAYNRSLTATCLTVSIHRCRAPLASRHAQKVAPALPACYLLPLFPSTGARLTLLSAAEQWRSAIK